jgi:hypothetical protein
MFDRGLFIVEGGVEKAAEALGVTRFTIYNYLDAAKSRRTEPARYSNHLQNGEQPERQFVVGGAPGVRATPRLTKRAVLECALPMRPPGRSQRR